MALEGHGQCMVGGEPAVLTRRHFSLAHREKCGIYCHGDVDKYTIALQGARTLGHHNTAGFGAVTFAIDASNTQLITRS